VNGNVTISSGTLTAPTGSFTVSGNWARTGGTFNPGTGTVTLDGADQTISGSTAFSSLKKNVLIAATLTFAVGQAQTFQDTLDLKGATGQLLLLRSSLDGTQWNVDPQGITLLDFLDVKDSNNLSSSTLSCTTCVDSSNNIGWRFSILQSASSILSSISVDGATSILTVYSRVNFGIVPLETAPLTQPVLVTFAPAPATRPLTSTQPVTVNVAAKESSSLPAPVLAQSKISPSLVTGPETSQKSPEEIFAGVKGESLVVREGMQPQVFEGMIQSRISIDPYAVIKFEGVKGQSFQPVISVADILANISGGYNAGVPFPIFTFGKGENQAATKQ